MDSTATELFRESPHSTIRERRRRRVRIVAIGVLVLGVVGGLAIVFGPGDSIDAEVGATGELLYVRPDDVPAAKIEVATASWRLDQVRLGSADPLSGGVTLADLDGDEDLDLVAVNGRAVVLLWDVDAAAYGEPIDLGLRNAVSAAVRDLDGDGHLDIAVARTGKRDRVIWGGGWLLDRAESIEFTDIDGGNPSSALLPADLNGDSIPELIRLGRGGRNGTADLLWTIRRADRSFSSVELPNSKRISLAATVSDVDRDGLLDIWVTRDVGWDTGGDSVYSRRGDRDGAWFDIADEIGAAVEIDGMGITLADLDGDSTLDAYISDIGENEILGRTGAGFSAMVDTGAGRIRPPGQPASIVSSSWASGAADINLDGRLDLVVIGGGFPDAPVRNKVPGTSVVDQEPPALLLGIGNGRFVDAWSETGLSLDVVGRSMALGDVDGDGDTDAVVMTYDGTLAALRNDIQRPSIRVVIDEACGEGIELSIVSIDRSYSTLSPQFTYGGSHAREVIVGTNDASVRVTATAGGESFFDRELLEPSDRETIRLTSCGADR